MVKNEKQAKMCVNLQKFLDEIKNFKEMQDKQQVGTKISFRNRRERQKFYSGKKEEIEAKYQNMKEELLDSIAEA